MVINMKQRKKYERDAILEDTEEKKRSMRCPIWASSIDISVKCRNQYEETLYEDVVITKILPVSEQ